MNLPRPKKHLGQHFLTDDGIANKIAGALNGQNIGHLFEIGPGKGILTSHLAEFYSCPITLVELDEECVNFLGRNESFKDYRVLYKDFLGADVQFENIDNNAVIGNFPYNISTQIVFKIIENRHQVSCFAGMFQKEVAVRLCSGPGNKDYGITSVLLQAFYTPEYLFTVEPNAFYPPPKVQSGVMRAVRRTDEIENLNVKLFFEVVKMAFNQRRKVLSNALKGKGLNWENPEISAFKSLRAERLSVDDFVKITKACEMKN